MKAFWNSFFRWVLPSIIVLLPGALLAVAIAWGHSTSERRERAQADRDLNGPCHDMSWLLATTSGSPSQAKCPNKRHRMKVATRASSEEVAALVLCQCQEPPPPPAASESPAER